MIKQPPNGLDDFYSQQLTWTDPAEDALAGLRCVTISVPLDYNKLDGRTLTLTLARHQATNPAARRGVLLVGPGDDLGNRGLPLTARLVETLPAEVLAHYDVVGFDHRFMGSSSPIFCGLEADERFWVFHYPQSFEAEVRFQANVAAKCAERAIDLLPYANSRNICRDIDVIRGVLCEEKISYIGYSYGTYLGAVYSEMFGQHLDRVVLDSICNPDWVWRGLFTDFPPNGERALNRWARWAAPRHDKYGLGRTPDEVRASYDRLLGRVDRGDEVQIMGFRLDQTLVRLIAVGILNSERGYPFLADIIRCVLNGGALEQDTLKFLAKMFGQPKEESGTAAQLAILAGDWAWPRSLDFYEREMRQAHERYPWTGASLCGIKATAFWPVPPSEPATQIGAGRGAESILLVNAADDMTTPHAAAVRMHEVLAHNSRLLTVADTAHHCVYPFYGNVAADEVITEYLVTGKLPDNDLTCTNPNSVVASATDQADPGPGLDTLVYNFPGP